MWYNYRDLKGVITMITKEQLRESIDKYGDSSKLVNRLGIAEEEVTEIAVLAPWCQFPLTKL